VPALANNRFLLEEFRIDLTGGGKGAYFSVDDCEVRAEKAGEKDEDDLMEMKLGDLDGINIVCLAEETSALERSAELRFAKGRTSALYLSL
jgi:hypothetical protein